MEDMTRRGFTTAVTGSLIVGFDAWAAMFKARAQDSAEVAAMGGLDGELLLDQPTRNRYAQDYGQIVHEQPRAVLLPGSLDDVVRAVRFARRYGLRIAVRGQGHQPFGQAQVRDGVVIDMRSLDAVHAISADRVELEAGASWRALLESTLPRLAPPVLTSHLGLSVGGTLSVGGVGLHSLRSGAQVDQVLALQVVTGTGEVLHCSAREHAALFNAALAGQGQCAIITRATLRLGPAQPMVREYTLGYADLDTLLEDQASLLRDARFDGAVALLLPTTDQYALTAVRQFTPPALPDDAALTAGMRFAKQSTRDLPFAQFADGVADMPFVKSRPDLGLLLPGSQAARFVRETLPRLTDGDLGGVLGIRAFQWDAASFTRPLFRIPGERTLMYFTMLRSETTDPATISRMLAGNRTLFERARALGGTLYPFAALELSHADWQRHYGSAWPLLRAAKLRHDPDDIFASGPDLRFS